MDWIKITSAFYYPFELKYYIMRRLGVISLVTLMISSAASGQAKGQGVLILMTDTATNKHGYRNEAGKIIIPFGKYPFKGEAICRLYWTNDSVKARQRWYVALNDCAEKRVNGVVIIATYSPSTFKDPLNLSEIGTSFIVL
jgi:hypothetical protein